MMSEGKDTGDKATIYILEFIVGYVGNIDI
jgi:hypothetical protein